MKTFEQFVNESDNPPKFKGLKWKRIPKGKTQEFDVEYEAKIKRKSKEMTLSWAPEEPNVVEWDIDGYGSNLDGVDYVFKKKFMDNAFDQENY